jgi:BioD-like phosphotransacetylase family protein
MDKSDKDKGGAPLGNQNAAKGFRLTAMLTAALENNNLQLMREGIKKIAEDFAAGDKSTRDFVFDRLEGKAIQTTNVNITKTAREFSDAELLAIAGSAGTTSETRSEEEPNSIH